MGAGFTSSLNSLTGSHLIYKMYKKYIAALDDSSKPMPFIHEIFDEIQTELQQEGKQLPECVWNDNTRYLTFKVLKRAWDKKKGVATPGGDLQKSTVNGDGYEGQ